MHTLGKVQHSAFIWCAQIFYSSSRYKVISILVGVTEIPPTRIWPFLKTYCSLTSNITLSNFTAFLKTFFSKVSTNIQDSKYVNSFALQCSQALLYAFKEKVRKTKMVSFLLQKTFFKFVVHYVRQNLSSKEITYKTVSIKACRYVFT